MTVETAPDTDDLDAFEKLMFGQTQSEEVMEDVPEEVVEEVPEDKIQDKEVDEVPEEDLEEDPTPEPTPKKNRFQERIDELTTARREAERREAETRAKLDEILSKLEPKEVKTEVKTSEDGPTPDDTDEKGEPLYPLGEFDKNYIRDLARHTIKQEAEAQKALDREEAEKVTFEKAQEALHEAWTEKLSDAIESRYPDMLDKNQSLAETFKDLDPKYGEFLAATIMSMDYGVDVLYHLGSNPDEAQRIVNSGSDKALVALGRIEARYALQSEESKEKKLKVSAAPEPPARLNRGTSVSKDVPDDTDDLDAFERKFYKRR